MIIKVLDLTEEVLDDPRTEVEGMRPGGTRLSLTTACAFLSPLVHHSPRFCAFMLSSQHQSSVRHFLVSTQPNYRREMARHIVLHRVSENVPPLACYNFDAHEWILIFFGRNVTDKVDNQTTLYYASSNNLCFCTTWQNGETRKSYFSLNWIVLHTQCTCVLSS